MKWGQGLQCRGGPSPTLCVEPAHILFTLVVLLMGIPPRLQHKCSISVVLTDYRSWSGQGPVVPLDSQPCQPYTVESSMGRATGKQDSARRDQLGEGANYQSRCSKMQCKLVFKKDRTTEWIRTSVLCFICFSLPSFPSVPLLHPCSSHLQSIFVKNFKVYTNMSQVFPFGKKKLFWITSDRRKLENKQTNKRTLALFFHQDSPIVKIVPHLYFHCPALLLLPSS